MVCRGRAQERGALLAEPFARGSFVLSLLVLFLFFLINGSYKFENHKVKNQTHLSRSPQLLITPRRRGRRSTYSTPQVALFYLCLSSLLLVVVLQGHDGKISLFRPNRH